MLGMRRGRSRWVALVVAVGVAGASLVTVVRADDDPSRRDLGAVPPEAADGGTWANGFDDEAALASPLRVLPALASDQRWLHIRSPQSSGIADGRITSFRDPSRPDAAVSVVVAQEGHGVWKSVRRAGADDPVDVGGTAGYRWEHDGRTVIAWRPATGTMAAVVGRGVSAADLLSTVRSLEIKEGRASIVVEPHDLAEVATHTVSLQGVHHAALALDFGLPTIYEAELPHASDAPSWTVAGAARDDAWLEIAEALDARVQRLDIAGRDAILMPDEDKLVVLLDASNVVVLYGPSSVSFGPATPPELLVELATTLEDYDPDAWRALATSVLEFGLADVVISEQRTPTSHDRFALVAYDPVTDSGLLCTEKRTITSAAPQEFPCEGVVVGQRLDRCGYELGWTIGFGSPRSPEAQGGLLYGTVRSEATSGSVLLDDDERVPLTLTSAPAGSAFQIFTAPIPADRRVVSATATGPTGTWSAAWVSHRNLHDEPYSRLEDPSAGLGTTQHGYGGNCPG